MIDRREIEVLRSLLQSGSEASLSDLIQQFDGEAAALHAVIESLERDGYWFERTATSVRLQSEPDAIRPQSIGARLTNHTIGREIYVFRQTTSTNDLVRRAGIGNAAEGVVFFAEQQTAGRGTQGRNWVSQPNQGLWFSILLRSKFAVDQLPLLVRIAALAAAESAEQWIESRIRIKPPNDLILGGGKLAGFLLETSNAWNFQILGIGMNIRSAPRIEGYPTSALDEFAKQPVPLAELAAQILNRFEGWYLKEPIQAVDDAFEAMVQGSSS
ncbi:MAG: biotin--[acetyl-CoA-carboxylase] ligase [Verrucomicrobia bacterium]|nr:biotin--[acetyl-CoA-carboxylase] ligase [Verrucomicrobiota bacterium]MBV8486278.1 biotin--[acetyl-CoA-carboxylase] ligase [Verrucomicrobiota bacterium]